MLLTLRMPMKEGIMGERKLKERVKGSAKRG
jgi:hypothetical protein